MNKKQKAIKVFSTPTCPWCTRVKEYLDENQIEYEDIDVATNREWAIKMIEKSGHQGVPQLWIGNELVVGFNKEKIDDLLELE